MHFKVFYFETYKFTLGIVEESDDELDLPGFCSLVEENASIPRNPQDAMDIFLNHFTSRISKRHDMSSVCFAASETFVIDYQGEDRILGCLAVLQQSLENGGSTRGSLEVGKSIQDLHVDFTMLPITGACDSPVQFLQAQSLGSYFDSERFKRAAWFLAELPSGSHDSASSTFRWIQQRWSKTKLRYGIGLLNILRNENLMNN